MARRGIFVDCFSGVAGDMLMGAAVDAGAPVKPILDAVATLPVDGIEVSFVPVRRGPLAATRAVVEVTCPDPQRTRTPAEISDILSQAKLPQRPLAWARAAFDVLARAEARVHGCEPHEVHLHEVGALDALADVVGACVALDALKPDEIHASAQVTGRGQVKTAHGLIPIPAPAALEIWREAGVTARELPTQRELTTPTGAALLAAVAQGYGAMPELLVTAVGYGAGSGGAAPDEPTGAEPPIGEPGPDALPNVVRLVVGDAAASNHAAGTPCEVVLLEANIDDMPAEWTAHLLEQLQGAGALETWTTAVGMKKSRPATVVSALCRPDQAAGLEAIFFAESTTLGVRRHALSRSVLARETMEVETPFGRVRAKLSRDNTGRLLNAKPEHDDCRDRAREHGVPLRVVWHAAVRAIDAQPESSPPPHKRD